MTDETPTTPNKSGFLNDHQGNPSSMRLMSVVALIASIIFGLITIQDAVSAEPSKNLNGLYITVAFLLGAFAPKALQKFAESKFPS
jgi:hypothetical protein